ncbi:MAG: PQQ-binding-like beta-propeller repeat protein [Candidatus Bathyarchaeia archaeon]
MLNKISENKAFYTMALTLILTVGIFAVLPTASSSTPPISIPTYAYLAVTPNPVGIGQTVFLVMWLHAAPPTAAGNAGDRWHDFTITVTKPDQTTTKLGPFISDPTGSTYTLYTVDQLGTYMFKFDYSGQVLSLYNPTNGLPGSPSPYVNDTFLPSSTTVALTVQQQQIAPVEEYPLPTDFWTRPISADNVRWSSISSNWLRGAQTGGYNLWQTGSGPSSPHILWKRPIEFGGVVGGNWPLISGYKDSYVPDAGFYSGGSYEGRYANSIILGGRIYFAETLGHSNTGGGYTCLDLKTGEVLWHRDDINAYYSTAMNTSISNSSAAPSIPAPSFGQIYEYESPNQHGGVGGLLWQSSSAGGVTTWQAFDAYTGKWVFNETNVAGGSQVYTNRGEIVNYVLNYNTATRSGWLSLWNNTAEQQGLHLSLGTGTNAWQWRPDGKTVNMGNAYTWNVTITADLTGNANPAIVQVIPGDVILGRSSAVSAGVGDKFTPDPFTLWAISDKPATRGQLLWKQSYPAPSGNLTRRFLTLPIDITNRMFIMSDVETMQFIGYSLDTGNLMWGPTNIPVRAYQYYGSGEGGGQRGALAYGNLYVQGFGGELLCIDTKNGNLVWKYNNTNSGLDTPWGLRPIFLAAIADGKVYAFNNEHSPNDPLYRGNCIYCIDAFTGQEIYKMLSWSGQTGGTGTSTAALADGVLTYYNYYDNSLYAIGKGPSATTVSAPQTVVPKGTGVLITGTVTDQSAGAKGSPAISDASMAAWMEYVYMQKPKPADATGVTVKLIAYDPNGNQQNIGTTTTDAYGNFGITWTPPVEGTYYVEASFEGSNSYYGSSNSAYLAVGPAAPAGSVAPPPTQPPATQTPPPVTATPTPPPVTASPSVAPPPEQPAPTEMYIIAGVAVAIIVVAAAAAIVLRRRK